MNYRYFQVLIALISLMPLLNAMDAELKKEDRVQVKSKLQWPAFLYWEPFPGSILMNPPSQSALDRFKLEAHAAKIPLDDCPSSERGATQLDWVFALDQVEKEGLLEKQFETWTVADIQKVSSWLTRSTVKNPGKFRTESTVWEMEAAQPQELIRLNALVQKPHRTAEENAFVRKFFHWFPEPEHVESMLAEKLGLVQRALKKAYTLPPFEKHNSVIRLAALMHFEIVWVHPFEGAHKRLGRVLMYVILLQNGIAPFTFYDSDYIEELKKGLAIDGGSHFTDYCLSCQIKDAHLKANSNYYAMVKSVAAHNKNSATLSTQLMVHPLNAENLKEFKIAHRPQALQQIASMAAVKPVQTSQSLCALCGKVGTKKCGRCKAVFYCSAECQGTHWKAKHKAECLQAK